MSDEFTLTHAELDALQCALMDKAISVCLSAEAYAAYNKAADMVHAARQNAYKRRSALRRARLSKEVAK